MRRDAPHVNGSASHEPARDCNVLALSLPRQQIWGRRLSQLLWGFCKLGQKRKIKDSISSERFYFGTLKTSSHFAFAGLSALFRSDCFTGASVCVCFRPGKDE